MLQQPKHKKKKVAEKKKSKESKPSKSQSATASSGDETMIEVCLLVCIRSMHGCELFSLTLPVYFSAHHGLVQPGGFPAEIPDLAHLFHFHSLHLLDLYCQLSKIMSLRPASRETSQMAISLNIFEIKPKQLAFDQFCKTQYFSTWTKPSLRP